MDNKKHILISTIDDPLFLDIAYALQQKKFNLYCITNMLSIDQIVTKIGINSSQVLEAINFFKISSYPLNHYSTIGLQYFNIDIWEKLQECYAIYLTMIDSFDVIGQPVREYRKLYRQLLLFWLGFLKSHTIDFIFFTSTPNQGWDTVLFYLSKIMNIRSRILFRTSIPDRVFLSKDFGDNHFSSELPKEREASKNYKSKVPFKNYEDSLWTQYSIMKNEKAIENISSLDIKENIYAANHSFKIYENSFDSFNQKFPFYYQRMPSNNLKDQAFSDYKQHVRELKKFYNTHTSPIDYNSPILFFALHCEPGRTTQPEAGVFEDQILAINLLHQAMPLDWDLFVKEHPRQFDASMASLKQMHYRTIQDYEHLLLLKRVKFLPVVTNSNDLIERAKIVSTCTGSIGWQALNKGIPTLVFGNPWYAGCKSCFRVDSVSSCKDAIKSADNRSAKTVQIDVHRFISEFYPRTFLGNTRHMFALLSDTPYEKMVKSMTNHLEITIIGLNEN